MVKAFVGGIIGWILISTTFSGCATASKRYSLSQTEQLQPGKTTAAEFRALFGEPTESDIQTGPDGKFEMYRYIQRGERWGKGCARIVFAEFKSDLLNGYEFGSSFDEDRTSFAVTNISRIEWAASTREEVQELLGKPHGKISCPTHLFRSNPCKVTGREIWVYNDFQPVPLMTPVRIKPLFAGVSCAITFDERGFVIDVLKTERSAF